MKYACSDATVANVDRDRSLMVRTGAPNRDAATFSDLTSVPPVMTPEGSLYSFPLQPQDADPYYQKRSGWLFLITKPGEETATDFHNPCFQPQAQSTVAGQYTFRIEAFNDNWTKEFAEGLI